MLASQRCQEFLLTATGKPNAVAPGREVAFPQTYAGLRLASSLRKMSILLTPGDVKKSFSPAHCCRSLPGGI
jgi:hypothetical protein